MDMGELRVCKRGRAQGRGGRSVYIPFAVEARQLFEEGDVIS